MFEHVGTLLTDPDRFFEHRGDDPSLTEPALVVLSIVAVSTIAGVVMIAAFAEAVPSDVQVFLLIGGLIGVLFGAVVPFVQWLLYAVAFQVITYCFGGEGEFRDLFALTGWGFLPRLFGALLSLAVTVYVVQTMPAPTDVAAFTAYSSELQNQAVYQVSSAASILFALWSAYIWVPAVQRARDVTRRQAIVTVVIPVAIGILLTIAGLLFSTVAQGTV